MVQKPPPAPWGPRGAKEKVPEEKTVLNPRLLPSSLLPIPTPTPKWLSNHRLDCYYARVEGPRARRAAFSWCRKVGSNSWEEAVGVRGGRLSIWVGVRSPTCARQASHTNSRDPLFLQKATCVNRLVCYNGPLLHSISKG